MRDFDLTETGVREWVEQAERDSGARVDGGLTTASAAYRPISGATEYTCSVDSVYQRMIVRY